MEAGRPYLRDYAVEAGASIAKAVFACSELSEVPSRSRNSLIVEFEGETTSGF